MEPFSYTLPAVRGKQAGREYFVTICPFGLVPRLFQFDDLKIPRALQLQRILNRKRLPEMVRYLTEHRKSYVLSSLTGSIDTEIQFEQVPGSNAPATLGYLKIPLGAQLVIHDGLHRRAAI